MEIVKPEINLFIVGAAKCGTTSLYNYLAQHPDVYFSRVKEPNFYSDAESHNPAAYLKPKKGQFYHNKIINDKDIYYSLFDEVENEKIVADSSPSYLWDINAANHIFKDFPNAKIIILLRDPIQRAFSHFLMDLKDGNQSNENFKEALLNDAKTQPKIWGRSHLYTEIGMYHDQVKNYIDTFGSNQVKVIIYKDFITNTQANLKAICRFLNIEEQPIDLIDYNKVYNPYVVPKSKLSKLILTYKNKLGLLKVLVPKFVKEYLNNKMLFKQEEKPKINNRDKTYLYTIFEKDIIKLENLLQIDLKQWKL